MAKTRTAKTSTAKSGTAAVRAAQQRSITGLAWATMIVALVGGTLSSGTWIGNVLRFFLKLFPWPWIPPVLLLVAVIALGLDILVDLEPNKAAVIALLLIPSIASATHGKLGDEITHWAKALVDWLNKPLAEWIGTDSTTGLAIACIVAAALMSRRVVRKSKNAGLV